MRIFRVTGKSITKKARISMWSSLWLSLFFNFWFKAFSSMSSSALASPTLQQVRMTLEFLGSLFGEVKEENIQDYFWYTRCLLTLSVIYLETRISKLNWYCFKTVNSRCKTWCNLLDIFTHPTPPQFHHQYTFFCLSSSTWWVEPDRHLLDVVPVDDGEDSLRGSPRLLFLLCLPQLCQVGAKIVMKFSRLSLYRCRSHSLDILVRGNKYVLLFWYSQDSHLGPSARHSEFLLDDFSESCRANPHQGGPLSLKYCWKNHLDKYHYKRKSEKATTVFQIANFIVFD